MKKSPDLVPGALLGGTYRIVGRVGFGGMGEVYEAAHTRLGGRYAVKVLHPEVSQFREALDRFKREALITSELRHPNIVQIVDFNSLENGSPYLVMEFVEGRELSGLIASQGALAPARVLNIVRQTASALSAAHARGIVHRDLKPQNIIVGPGAGEDSEEMVKVLDFGLCKLLDTPLSGSNTLGGALLGTPGYMSPEQIRGQAAEVDARADEFALGCMTYEMLTGRRPFTGDNVAAIVYRVLNEPPATIGGVPSAVDAVVQMALAKNRDERFSTVVEFARALERAATGRGLRRLEVAPSGPHTVVIPPPTTPAAPGPAPSAPAPEGPIAQAVRSKRWRSSRAAIAGAAASAVAGVAVLLGMLRAGPQVREQEPAAAITVAAPPAEGKAPGPPADNPASAPPAAANDNEPALWEAESSTHAQKRAAARTKRARKAKRAAVSRRARAAEPAAPAAARTPSATTEVAPAEQASPPPADKEALAAPARKPRSPAPRPRPGLFRGGDL